MDTIDYSWDNEDLKNNEKSIDQIEVDQKQSKTEIHLSTRKNLQLARRLFHMANGVGVATVYLISLTHQQMIHFLGTLLCVLYIVEQVRINYPETANKLLPITKFIIRAEEQLKESAMLPYTIAVLLTIITFPKPIAIVAIYTLAIADPLSAIIGIKYGKNKIVEHKSLEGSGAFFISTFICSIIVLSGYQGKLDWTMTFISFAIALLASAFEMIPLKLDDNLTIPLSTAFMLWILCGLFGVII